MNTKFTLALTVLLLAACSQKSSENKSDWKNYGPTKVNREAAIALPELISQMQADSSEKAVTIKAEIDEVCSKAGCWITINKPDGNTIRVIFKDHFTIPTDTEHGTMAYLHGRVYYDTIPVDMLQHYAEDAGKSADEIAKITQPEFELAFEADGITFEAKKEKN